MLQQTFEGQEFNLAHVSLLPEDGFLVRGICGPQAASEMDEGNGGVPVLKQMDAPRLNLLDGDSVRDGNGGTAII